MSSINTQKVNFYVSFLRIYAIITMRGISYKESEYKNMREELALFSHNLQVYMDTHNYSQASLSNAVGVGHATVNDWCHGRKFPRIGTLDKLCELFHCKRSDLLEKYTTEESIKASEIENEINEYMTKLNAEGLEHLLRYFRDLNPKFFNGGEENVQ